MPNHPIKTSAVYCVPITEQDQELRPLFSRLLCCGRVSWGLRVFCAVVLFGAWGSIAPALVQAQIQWTALPTQLTRGERVRVAGKIDLSRLPRPGAKLFFRIQHPQGVQTIGQVSPDQSGDFSLWLEIPKDLPTQKLRMLVSLRVPPAPSKSSPPPRATPREPPPLSSKQAAKKRRVSSRKSLRKTRDPARSTSSKHQKSPETPTHTPKDKPSAPTKDADKPSAPTKDAGKPSAPTKDADSKASKPPTQREDARALPNDSQPSRGATPKPSNTKPPALGTHPKMQGPSSLSGPSSPKSPSAQGDRGSSSQKAGGSSSNKSHKKSAPQKQALLEKERQQKEQARQRSQWERLKKGWRPADENSEETKRSGDGTMPRTFRLPPIPGQGQDSFLRGRGADKARIDRRHKQDFPTRPEIGQDPPSSSLPKEDPQDPDRRNDGANSPRTPLSPSSPADPPRDPSAMHSKKSENPTSSPPKEDWKSRAAKWLKKQKQRQSSGQQEDWQKEQAERERKAEELRRRMQQLRRRFRQLDRPGQPQEDAPSRRRSFGDGSGGKGGGFGGGGGHGGAEPQGADGQRPRVFGDRPRAESGGGLGEVSPSPRSSEPQEEQQPPLMLPPLQSRFGSRKSSSGQRKQGDAHQTAQRGQVLSRSKEYKMDTNTSGGRVFLRQVFTPYLPHHQRITSLDQWNEGYHLTLRSSRKRRIRKHAMSRPGFRRFRGLLRVLLWPGKWTPIPSVSPNARMLWAFTSPRVRGVRFAKDSAKVLYMRASVRKPQVVELRFALEADPLYFGGPIPKGITPSMYPHAMRPYPRSEKRKTVLAHLHEWELSSSMTLDQILMHLVPYLRSFSARELRLGERQDDMYLTLMRRRVGVCRHRAMLFVTTMQALGYPARFVANGAHAFAEVGYPDGRWRLIDLGGGDVPNWMGKWKGKPFEHPEDPFPTPQVPEKETREEEQQHAKTPPIDTRPDRPDPRKLGIGGKQVLRNPVDALKQKKKLVWRRKARKRKRHITHHSPLSTYRTKDSPLQRRLRRIFQP